MINSDKLNPQELTEDQLITPSLRPRRLKDFLGQNTIKNNLKVFIQACTMRTEHLDHILLYGPPGLGKTTLAEIIAREMSVEFHSTSGPALSKSGDIAAILTSLKPNDVLFIDEIHRLNKTVEETLYSAMEDFKLDLIIGEGPSARTIKIDLTPFTLVAATTRAGLLGKPLRDRFGISFQFQFYSYDELRQILHNFGKKLNISGDDISYLQIAKSSRGTPRIAQRLLKRIRDFATVNSQNQIKLPIVNLSLQKLGIDTRGLDQLDRNYLNLIYNNYKGGPVGLDTITTALASETDIIADIVEPFLIQKGFVQKTSKGRIITLKGIDIVKDIKLIKSDDLFSMP